MLGKNAVEKVSLRAEISRVSGPNKQPCTSFRGRRAIRHGTLKIDLRLLTLPV
jgi:hypothetical protein